MVRNLVNSEPVRAGLVVKGELPLCTLQRMDDTINMFGVTPHVPVKYQDNEGNYHFGWIPEHIWDTILHPMTRKQ